MHKLVKKFRKKLEDDRRTLVWFHHKYVSNFIRYSYFIRKLNLPEEIDSALAEKMKEYLKSQ